MKHGETKPLRVLSGPAERVDLGKAIVVIGFVAFLVGFWLGVMLAVLLVFE